MLVLAERLKKKDPPGKFYKISTKNKFFFNKDEVFVITKKKKKDKESILLSVSKYKNK